MKERAKRICPFTAQGLLCYHHASSTLEVGDGVLELVLAASTPGASGANGLARHFAEADSYFF